MNRLDIIRMAKEAACGWAMNGTEPLLVGAEHLERFAELVANAEREACAEVCEDLIGTRAMAQHCADAIRAKGQA